MTQMIKANCEPNYDKFNALFDIANKGTFIGHCKNIFHAHTLLTFIYFPWAKTKLLVLFFLI